MEQYPLFTLFALGLLAEDREGPAGRTVPGHEADRLASLARSRVSTGGTGSPGTAIPADASRGSRFRLRPRRPAAVPAG
ncbi:hypothetical protein [Streptomyces alkaliphilus]|uniref:hypothetical protein n=1 Tax=Streptomyces alkaliphilus TaxID=1472722 RepID=UPI00117ED836|nr:hypothetical protein [Streptomyces alkaliphilus]MQS07876.1 hypothetical protein [Streptomyces alkaliphilus]